LIIKLLLILFILSSATFGYELKIQGNTKTQPEVIKKEIADIRSNKLSEKVIAEIKRRVWNLRLFTSVEVRQDAPDKVLIDVSERWTLIPIVKLAGGGGSSYIAVGAYDINSFGTNTELGAQYENLNGRSAGVMWFRKPQFLADRNLIFGMDFWKINRVRYLYTRQGDDDGAFTLERDRVNAFVEKKWSSDFFKLGFAIDYHSDRISEFGLSDDELAQNTLNGFAPNEESINLWKTLYFNVGRLNYINYLVDGQQVSLTTSHIDSSSKDKSSGSLKYNFYHLFENRHNFAFQALVSRTNFGRLQYQNYIGGLSEVRGYLDGQFFDRAFIQTNIEHRFDLFENRYGVVQGAIFSDQAKEGKTISKIAKSSDAIMLSSGFGVRLISPKIFRFVARLDYAQTHTRYIDRSVSFGIQQFF